MFVDARTRAVKIRYHIVAALTIITGFMHDLFYSIIIRENNIFVRSIKFISLMVCTRPRSIPNVQEQLSLPTILAIEKYYQGCAVK